MLVRSILVSRAAVMAAVLMIPGLAPASPPRLVPDAREPGAPATAAIVDAFGYADLESDLATYRAQFGLPPCTRASGCLTILNQDGATAPLPPESPPDNDWSEETALDVDAISAACPT